MNSRLTRLLFLPFLFVLTACPNHDSEIVTVSPSPAPVGKPANKALNISLDAPATFCCDPNGPFPQVIGAVTVRNTNGANTRPLDVLFDFGGNSSTLLKAKPDEFALAAGESRTVEIIATSCGFRAAKILIDWGYDKQPEAVRTLTVTNACPPTSDVAEVLTALCDPAGIPPLFYPSYVIALFGELIKHSSVLVPVALITLPFIEIKGYGAFPVLLTAAKLAAAFHGVRDGVAFPPGDGPNGYTIYPDMPVPMFPGEYLAVYQVVDDTIPLADPDLTFQFGFVFDSDNDAANNYVPAHPFTNDFFRDTDRWYEVAYSPITGWNLKCKDASQPGFPESPTSARVVIRGNTMMLLVPTGEFSVRNPRYRVTSFAHRGDFGLNPPHDWSGDPTPAVDAPLARITR